MQHPDPIAFTIGNLDIKWYGIIISLGFVLAILISDRRASSHNLSSDNVLDLAILLIPISIIGARAYYVIFQFDNYRGDFLEMLNIRSGGLAIHGGIIAGVITGLIYCKVKNINFWNFADLIFPQVALAQSIGRWGNFFNGEAHGCATSLPWAIEVDGMMVHPTFLYESIWCALLFVLLIFIDKRRKFQGQIVLLYGMLYSLERFFVEELRTDSLMIGNFKQARLISISIFAACLVIYIFKHNKETNI